MSMASAPSNGARSRRPGRHHVMADINVTPLVDVMLVLLVIFMITAPVLEKSSIDVDLPKVATGTGNAKGVTRGTTIVIDSSGKVHVGEQVLEPEAAAAEIPKLLKGREKEAVTLKAHRSLPYDSVVRIMSIVRGCGVGAISISVEGPSRTVPARRERGA